MAHWSEGRWLCWRIQKYPKHVSSFLNPVSGNIRVRNKIDNQSINPVGCIWRLFSDTSLLATQFSLVANDFAHISFSSITQKSQVSLLIYTIISLQLLIQLAPFTTLTVLAFQFIEINKQLSPLHFKIHFASQASMSISSNKPSFFTKNYRSVTRMNPNFWNGFIHCKL